MAIAFVATRITFGASAVSAAHVVSITNPTLITVGNYLVLGITFGGLNTGAPTSITDPRGNTWRDTLVVADNGSNHGARIWYAKVATAYQAGDSITVNLGASRIMTCAGSEYSGLQSDDTTVLDQIANASDTVGSDTAFDTGLTPSTTVADELLFGDMAAGATASTPTPEVLSPVWNAAGNAASTVTVRRVWTFYRIVAATGTYQFKGTLALAGIDSEGIATFKGAAAGTFDPSTGFPWAREGDDAQAQALPVEDPSAQAWAVGPPQNAVQLRAFAVEGGEVQAVPGEDPSIQAWAVRPPVNAVQLQAWSREGEETVAVPGEDPTVPAWAVGPPQNAVRLQAFTQPDETQAQPGDDPTGQAYPIQPPAAAGFDPASGPPWAREGAEELARPTPDDTPQAWSVGPPQNAVIAQPINGDSEVVQALPQPDPSEQAWAVGPPQNADRLSAWPGDSEVVQQVPLEDPSVQSWPVQVVGAAPAFNPASGFPWNADDSERFYQQQLTDDNVGYALGLVPANVDRAVAFNQPDEAAQAPISDDTGQALAIQPPVVTFDPSTLPWSRSDDIVQPVWALEDGTAQSYAIGPPQGLRAFNGLEPSVVPPPWIIDAEQGMPWTATIGAEPSFSGGFPPVAMASAPGLSAQSSAPVPGGDSSAPGPGGSASHSTPR